MPSQTPPTGDVAAALLLESSAVQLSPAKPFTLTSGKPSPVYFDCRRLISNPAAMNLVAGMFQWLLEAVPVDFVAGGESAGIPFADRLAALLGKPMLYVRKEARKHGTASQIEGLLRKGARVVLVEDMITDGASKLVFVDGLRAAGLVVEHCLVVLDRQQGGAETLAAAGVSLHSLTTVETVLAYGLRTGALSEPDVKVVREYLKTGA